MTARDDGMIRRAAARGPVQYPDRTGTTRTGTLVHWPVRGSRAKVRTPGGHYLSIRTADITLPPDEDPLDYHPTTDHQPQE